MKPEKLEDHMGDKVALSCEGRTEPCVGYRALHRILENPDKEYRISYTVPPSEDRRNLLKSCITDKLTELWSAEFSQCCSNVVRTALREIRTLECRVFPLSTVELKLGLKDPVLCTLENIQECIEKAKSEDSWVFTDFMSDPGAQWRVRDYGGYRTILDNPETQRLMLLPDVARSMCSLDTSVWVMYKKENIDNA